MIVTTWTCDGCGKKQTNPDDMWEVSISLKQCRHEGPYHSPRPGPKEVWCRVCVVKAGLVPPPKTVKDHPVAATLEDLVREIVHEELDGGGL